MVIFTNRNGAYVMLSHQSCDFGDGCVGTNPVYALMHRVFHFHGRSPLLECRSISRRVAGQMVTIEIAELRLPCMSHIQSGTDSGPCQGLDHQQLDGASLLKHDPEKCEALFGKDHA